ncbi:MAG: hypothetical protein LAT82_04130 [Nanoarchaeota archaeon]|nr:hypothetical protein [Nanoarchaeota archaeon]
MNTEFQKIKNAIENYNQIKFRYEKPNENHKWGERIGNPHSVYISRNEEIGEHLKIDIFQESGIGTEVKESLKQFVIEYIKEVQILNSKFKKNNRYDPTGERYEKVIVCIK